MAFLLRYRMRCVTDSKYEFVWAPESDPVPTVCPTDGLHTIDETQTTVVERSVVLSPIKFPCLSWVDAGTVKVGKTGDDYVFLDASGHHRIKFSGELQASLISSGAGGLDTGSETADTWYAVFVIGDSKGVNAPAALLSLATDSPTLPAGYDISRRVGWVRNDASSDLLRFHHDGRETAYDEPEAALRVLENGNATTFTVLSLATLVPPTSRLALVRAEFATGETGQNGDQARFRPKGSTLAANDTPQTIRPGMASSTSMEVQLRLPLDATQEVEYAVSDTPNSLSLTVQGYEEAT